MDRGERVDVRQVPHRQLRHWTLRAASAPYAVQVLLGVLGDGRWYVWRLDPVHSEARAYIGQQQAEQVARQVMAAIGEGWSEVTST